MKSILATVVASGFLLSITAADPIGNPGGNHEGVVARAGLERASAPAERGWIVKKTNNLCGLRDPAQLSNPAKLNYKRCLAATPEMKKMRTDGIKPESPEGIQLSNAAATRVSSAANTIRKAAGLCSVWKEIKHADGRSVSDITARVISQY